MKIKLDSGKITLGRHEIKDQLAKLDDGYYNWSIQDWKDSRSLQQNALYWKWMTIMGEHFGYRKKGMHIEMMRLFSPVYTVKDIKTGKPRQEPVRTSEMNVKQMHEYMNQVDQFAAEEGVVLPQPDDKLIESIMEEFDAVEQ